MAGLKELGHICGLSFCSLRRFCADFGSITQVWSYINVEECSRIECFGHCSLRRLGDGYGVAIDLGTFIH